MDEQLRVVVFNRAAETIFQCPASEAIGATLDRFIPEGLRQKHREHVHRFGHQGLTARSMSLPALLSAVRANGEEFPIEATISQVQANGEKIYTVILRDITERKLTEQALEESQKQNILLADLILASSQPLGIEYPDGRLGLVNPAFERLTGYTGEELRSMDWKRVLTPFEWRQLEQEKLAELNLTGVPVRYEKEYVRKDGTRVPVELLVHLATDPDGKPQYYYSFLTDTTERKRAEQALLRSEKLATVGRMAATIAHEINNPLGAVTNVLYLLKSSKNMPPSALEYLEIADAELKRIAYITRQSLGFYRESNAPALTTLYAVLDSAVDLLKSKIKVKHVVVEKQWNSDVPIMAVAGELRQVFSNLISNSLDAVGEEGTIKLRISAAPHQNSQRYVRVTVADDGEGISLSSRRHIFEPFFTTKGTVGTGLGLWVSKQIVEKHGGTIRVRSNPSGAQRGTVFSVVLPVEPVWMAASSQANGR
jgi:PAS domain S-box-containing protein